MAFIRVKRFKMKKGGIMEYAYIVQNKRYKRNGKVKQKFKSYLGKVYRPKRINISDFFGFYNIKDINHYIKKRSKEEIIYNLLKWELFNHGFEEEKGIWRKDDCLVNIKEKKVYNKKEKDIALAFNDGLFCNYTIKKLFSRFEGDEREVGFKLANAFVEAGLKIPEEVFVGIYEKVISQ